MISDFAQNKDGERDVVPSEGKSFAYVYDAGDQHTEMLAKAKSCDLFYLI